ncbi:MAG: C25 family cysteine peptidase [Minicystis sp.]
MPEPDAASVPDDALSANGIDGTTGRPAFAPLTVTDIAARVRAELADQPFGIDHDEIGIKRGAEDIAESGWGVVVPEGLDPAVRRALDKLCAHRAKQAGARYQELDFRPHDDDFARWLVRHEISPGDPNHDVVPKYLLLLGPPELIPLSFQYLLGIEYGVGRLCFDTPEEYARYAESVVAYETAPAATTAREICLWGPRRDRATEVSSDDLLAPLVQGWGRSMGLGDAAQFRTTARLAEEATKENLLAALHRTSELPPTLLFTASHGAVWPSEHARQAAEQGAILAHDWFPGEPVERAHRIAADDIADSARIHGLVAFLFACYSAGTPAIDSFPRSRAEPLRTIAPAPFISALPRRLLAHPGGGALGVIGHVDRAWGYSMKRAGAAPQVGPFREGLLRILRGAPLGDALADFGRRYSVLSTSLLSALDRGAASISDDDLARRWIERNDAQGYVLLGDPGASVRRDVTS